MQLGNEGPAHSAACGPLPAARTLLLLGCALFGGLPGKVVAAPGDPPPVTADIELRKSFMKVRSRGRQPGPQESARPGAGDPAAGADSEPDVSRQARAVAVALGETIASSGVLHMPLSGGRRVELAGERTPVLDFGTAHRVIIDAGSTVDPETAAEIARVWPAYAVAQPPPGGGLRGLIASVLAAAGYESVETQKTLEFGRGSTVRVTPDFLIQRAARDLLHGELRAVSVVDPADSLPPELRELAAEHRVRLVEIDADGRPAGPDRAPWRDPTGRVTTVDTREPAMLLAEIGAALGLATDHAALPPDRPVRGDGSGADPALDAVGMLLARSGVAAIGPLVELYRPSAARPRGRFVISVPGWLAEHGGRRLLITGAPPPPLMRLYLTREGIDIFEYRLR